MIVLDEQLLGRNLEVLIGGWYRGAVRCITDLRPHTVIKDEAIPGLLRTQAQPTFVTINERDFWRKVAIDEHFCVMCFVLSDARAGDVAGALRGVLQRPEFRTKAQRMGKVIRITESSISYYTARHPDVQVLTR